MPEEQLFLFRCRECGGELQVSIELLPIDGPCPCCGTRNVVSAPAAAGGGVSTTTEPKTALTTKTAARRSSAATVVWRIVHTAVGVAAAIVIGGGAFGYVSRKLSASPESGRASQAADQTSSEILPTRREDGVVMLEMTEATPNGPGDKGKR